MTYNHTFVIPSFSEESAFEFRSKQKSRFFANAQNDKG